MIKELTKAQEKKIPEYLQKWLDVGYRTDSINKDRAKEYVNFLYTDILNINKPKYYIYLDSPMACNLAINLLKNTKFNTGSQLSSQLDSQLDSQLRSQLRSQLGSQLDSQLSSQLYSQLDSQLYSQLGSQLYSQLDSQLYSQLGSQLGSQLRWESISNINPRGYYYWTYDYILNELFKDKIKYFTKFNKYMEGLKDIHLTYMFEDIVFFSDFPERIKLDKDNNLHSTDSYALKYRDNYGIFSVHGELKNTRKIPASDLAKVLYPDAIVDGDFMIMMEE